MILFNVNDVLSIAHNAMKTMKEIQHRFNLKDDKIAEPENYLVTGLSKMVTATGREYWSMSPENYCKASVLKDEQKLNKEGKRLPTNSKTPLKSGYCPKLDVSQELKADGVQYYMELIGLLRWAVEIRRVHILYETSIMSTHLALPIVGHLEQLFHVFRYLKEERPSGRLILILIICSLISNGLKSMTGTTSTAMKKRQFRGTCLHLEETVLPRIDSKMRTLLATKLPEGARHEF